MPKFTNVSPLGALELPLVGRVIAPGETVTVTASEKEYVPVRGAVLKFYDAALFTFEKAN